jgi:membrane protease YdiL (CAAX protease family)
MSDVAVSLAHHAFESRRPVAASTPQKPVGLLGLGATLAWGAAGMAALMIFWITGQLPAPWMRLESYPLLVVLSFGHIAVVAVVMAALSGRALPFRDYLALPSLRWRDVKSGAMYGLLAYLALSVIYALIPLVQSAFGGGVGALAFVPPRIDGSGLTLLSIWIGMVIAAPIAEELLFRGLIYRGLADSRLGAFGAVVITSLAFGLVHCPGFGWPRVAGTACIGLLFGWVRWHTGNTWVAMVAHAVMNVMGATLLTVFVLVS